MRSVITRLELPLAVLILAGGLSHEYGWPVASAVVLGAAGVRFVLGATRLGPGTLRLSPAVVHGALTGAAATIVLDQVHALLDLPDIVRLWPEGDGGLQHTLIVGAIAVAAGVLGGVRGIKLIGVAHLRTFWRHHEILTYVVTAAGVLFGGLVAGVVLGLLAALAVSVYRLTHCTVTVAPCEDAGWRVTVRGTLVFLGVGRLLRELRAVPPGSAVTLELHVDFLDHAAFEALRTWREEQEQLGGRVMVEEVHDSWYQRAGARHPLLRKTLPGPPRRFLAPWGSWARASRDPITTGVAEFQRRGAELVRPYLMDLADGQQPEQFFITCADSRVVPNVITMSGPGDLFCVRNVGNLVPQHGIDPSIGAAIEFAVKLGVTSIAVCGHSDCGAMKATLSGKQLGGHLGQWLRHVTPSVRLFRETRAWPESASVKGHEWLGRMNVLQQLAHLRTYPAVAEAIAAGRLRLHGLYFDIGAAKVSRVCPDTGKLVEVPAS
ncbi:carbonic anhydrase [Longispora albida]|uniref:carbonic anhydrase n=1 Tax=Longispora albida TaxID=203523 RepID=UPI0012FC413D|nr:carbonic anhydrase [Longispora albida]